MNDIGQMDSTPRVTWENIDDSMMAKITSDVKDDSDVVEASA